MRRLELVEEFVEMLRFPAISALSYQAEARVWQLKTKIGQIRIRTIVCDMEMKWTSNSSGP